MRDYSTHPRIIVSSKSKKNTALLKFGIILTITLAVAYISIFKTTNSNNNQKEDSKDLSFVSSEEKPTSFKINSQKELLEKLNSIVSTSSGTYSLYVFDLNKNEGFGINEEMFLTAASVNKIPILAALYYLAGKDKIDLEKIIVPQEKDIQHYGTGSIQYDPTGTPYSIRTLARLMMEKSDNTAAYILASLIIGVDKIQNLVDSWELFQTKIADNKTSARDMALLLTKIYKGEITSRELTAEMLTFMKKSDFDDRIPTGVPPGTTVYHKTGDEVNKIHDVGIIDLKDRPYYLGILTTDITDEEETKKNMAEISRIVLDYMKKL